MKKGDTVYLGGTRIAEVIKVHPNGQCTVVILRGEGRGTYETIGKNHSSMSALEVADYAANVATKKSSRHGSDCDCLSCSTNGFW